jgi:Amt family ammonium transporter
MKLTLVFSAANASPALGKPLLDFAGAGVVHMVGGICALVGAYKVGPRMGFFDEEGKPSSIPGRLKP